MTETITLQIGGMTCVRCSAAVEHALKGLEKRRQALISDRLGKSGYVHGYEHSFHTSAGCPAG